MVQFANRDNADGDGPDWSEPTHVTLYVRRRDKDLKHRGRIYKAGEIIELVPNEKSWATYQETDYCPEDKAFLAEEYRMRILEIEDQSDV